MKQSLLIFTLLITHLICSFAINTRARYEKKKYKLNRYLFPKYGQQTFKPIRVNYVLLDSSIVPRFQCPWDKNKFESFKRIIIDPVDKFLQKSIKVYPLTDAPKLARGKLNFEFGGPFTVDYTHYFENGKYDYVFFIVIYPLKQGVLASAGTRFLADIENYYKRPAAGIINININYYNNFESKNAFEIKETRRVLYHEITHALAYSKELYQYYIDEDGEKYKESIILPIQYPHGQEFFLNHPKMNERIEEYYGCKNNHGYPLAKKDQSHFNQALSAEEIMRPVSDDADDRITVFMLALFDITGWYLVDRSVEEKTLYGKGNGCNFVNLECKDEKGSMFEEYCDPVTQKDEQGCDFYYESKSVCKDKRAELGINCQYWIPITNQKCNGFTKKSQFGEFSPSSKCFKMDIQGKMGSDCFVGICNTIEKSITLALDGNTYKAFYATGKSSIDRVSIWEDRGYKNIYIYFPQSFERFCFLQSNPQTIDKGFR